MLTAPTTSLSATATARAPRRRRGGVPELLAAIVGTGRPSTAPTSRPGRVAAGPRTARRGRRAAPRRGSSPCHGTSAPAAPARRASPARTGRRSEGSGPIGAPRSARTRSTCRGRRAAGTGVDERASERLGGGHVHGVLGRGQVRRPGSRSTRGGSRAPARRARRAPGRVCVREVAPLEAKSATPSGGPGPARTTACTSWPRSTRTRARRDRRSRRRRSPAHARGQCCRSPVVRDLVVERVKAPARVGSCGCVQQLATMACGSLMPLKPFHTPGGMITSA